MAGGSESNNAADGYSTRNCGSDSGCKRVSKKGPVVQSVVRGSVLSDKQGNTVLVCGLSADVSLNALKAGAL